jgi:hypothetical protein
MDGKQMKHWHYLKNIDIVLEVFSRKFHKWLQSEDTTPLNNLAGAYPYSMQSNGLMWDYPVLGV